MSRALYIRAVAVRAWRTLLLLLLVAPWPSAEAQERRRREAAGEATQEFTHAGRPRRYLVRVPPGLTRGARVPLVIVLHGGGGDGHNAEKMTGFTVRAMAERFIVVYPDGTSRRGPLLTWNAGHCCGPAMEDRVDDVGFINALIDTLSARHPIDPARIYATGISKGAMMSHRLGIELSHRLAAIAPVVGALFGDEARPANPVSAIIINGMLDASVPFNGGPPGGRAARAWEGKPARPSLEQATFWASAAWCTVPPQRSTRGAVTRTVYTCPGGQAVEHYAVADNGHAWPGGKPGSATGDPPSSSMNATDVIWRFFAAHPKR